MPGRNIASEYYRTYSLKIILEERVNILKECLQLLSYLKTRYLKILSGYKNLLK
jgi:hypothetical protein